MTIQDEIESFFAKASIISFCELEKDNPNGQPLVYLYFTEHQLEEFKKEEIHKKISDYFKDKKSKLLIFVKDDSPYKIAIVDQMTGNSINISAGSFDESINDFIELTPQTEEIILLTAYISSKEFLFHEEAVKNPYVVLDGYSLVYN